MDTIGTEIVSASGDSNVHHGHHVPRKVRPRSSAKDPSNDYDSGLGPKRPLEGRNSEIKVTEKGENVCLHPLLQSGDDPSLRSRSRSRSRDRSRISATVSIPVKGQRKPYLEQRWACTMVDFRRELGPQLEDLRSKGLFCDVTMVFPRDGRKMHVHRNIMASQYFRTLFTFNMTTSGHIEVEIPGVTYSDMEAIVQYAYTHKAGLDANNVQSVIVTADRFNVLGLLKTCEDFLLDNMALDNVIGMLKISRYLHCPGLERKTRDFVLKRFRAVATTSNEFLQLTPDELVQMLRSDDLNIQSEDIACAAVVKWVDFFPEVRSAYLPQLLSAIRLGLVSMEMYTTLLQRFYQLPTDSESMCILTKGYELCRTRAGEEQMITLLPCQSLGNPMLRPRVPEEVIFVLGGWSRDGVCADLESFDTRVDKWYESEDCSFEHSLAYHAMVTVGKTLYVIGGYTTVKYLNSAKKFEPKTKTWHEIAPMHTSRCYVCAAEVDGLIYACGGFDGSNRHCSVERYNPVRNQWQMVADMNSVRSDAGAAGVDGKLYVVGGFSGTECLNTSECLDPQTNQWTFLTPMACHRSGVTVVAFQQAIYAIGGFNGSVRLDEVEKYYPEKGAWFPVKEMIKGRSNFAATVMENRIYVVGGYDGSGTTGHVEFYESGRDEWSEADSMRVGRSAASACTVKGLDNVRDFTFYGKEAALFAPQEVTEESRSHRPEASTPSVSTRSRSRRSRTSVS